MAARTVRTYFEILQDTLLGYLISPFHRRAGPQSISAAPKFWRTKTGLEVDFVLNRGEVAVEVKGRVRRGDLRPSMAFWDEFRPRRSIVVTAERDRRRIDGVEVMPYQDFLLELHAGDIV